MSRDGAPPPPLVVHVVPTAVARGAQREARALADRLDAPGRRHHLLLSLFAGPKDVPVDVALDHRPGGGVVAQGFDPILALRLGLLLRRLDPAVVVAHGGDSLKYLFPATALRRRPLAYYATGTFAGAGRAWQVRVWRRLVGRADVVACEGEEVLEECRRLLGVPPARLVLAVNGRDPETFRPGGRGGEDGTPTLAFVGAFDAGKGPDRFVALVAGLRRRGLALRAVACGTGPLAAELGTAAADAGVELLGSVDDVASVLGGADVLVFPSRPTGEGMPGVLIEAGLCGLPVVATRVPGTSSIVEDGTTGLLVDVDDPAALAGAVARLVEDPALRRSMGEAARARCVARFGLDTVVETWKGFLEPLVEGAVRPGAPGRPAPRPAPGA